MKHRNVIRKKPGEAGAALLIAIFALLLISVVAIALVVSSGTDSALQSNYRTSTGAYYAALAGLEEARGRMLWSNPNFINITAPNFIPTTSGPPMGLNQVLYIINPANGETVAPWDTANPATYPDNEYFKEFGIDVGSATVQPAQNSVSTQIGLPGPTFKWVRITPATEKSLNIDVDQSHGNVPPYDSTTLLYYDPAHSVSPVGLKPSLILAGGPGTARQVFEVTALAVMPPNTQKLLQYVVAPLSYGLYFHGALVIPGSAVVSPTITFQGANTAAFKIDARDGTGPLAPAIPGCSSSGSAAAAVGLTDYVSGTANVDAVNGGIPATPAGLVNSYIGSGGTPDSVHHVYVNPAMQTPAGLNNMVEEISEHADAKLNGPASETDMPAGMNQSNPQTVVVNGNLTINGSFTGYGLLVVTGDLVANGDFGWKGVVLVIGSGNVTLTGGPGGNSEFDGAFFVAHTMDTTTTPPTPLASLGMVNFNATTAMGSGIYYNHCWIDTALRPPSYQVLSFREIPAP